MRPTNKGVQRRCRFRLSTEHHNLTGEGDGDQRRKPLCGKRAGAVRRV